MTSSPTRSRTPSLRATLVLTVTQALSVLLLTACGDDPATAPTGPASVEISGAPSSAVAGTPLVMRAVVLNVDGDPVAGVSVDFRVASGGGEVTPASVTTGAGGAATTRWLLGESEGMQRLAAEVGELSSSVSVRAFPASLASLQVLQGGQPETPVGWGLDEPVRLRAVDQAGRPRPDVSVTWAPSHGGRVEDADEVSDVDGVISAKWIAGPTPGLQRLNVTASEGEASTRVELQTEAFAGIRLRGGFPTLRVDRPAASGWSVWGGTPPHRWSLAEGELPAGVTLDPEEGSLDGTPSREGEHPVRVRVSDSEGGTGTFGGVVTVCGGVLVLDVGQEARAAFPDRCGVLLPDAPGAVYRVGVMARGPDHDFSSGRSTFSLRTRRLDGDRSAPVAIRDGGAAGALRMPSIFGPLVAGGEGAPDVVDPGDREMDGSRFLEVGPPPPREAESAAGLPATRTFDVLNRAAVGVKRVEARLRATSEHLAYYEDVGIASEEETVYDDETIRRALDRFELFGWPVLQEAFGGLGPLGEVTAFTDGDGRVVPVPARDVDRNGRILVLQVRPSLMANVAGFVYSCDRMPRPEHAADPFFACEESNEAEIMYVRGPGTYLMVHEARHIASQGWRIWGGTPVQPRFIEEGTAVMASELAGRRAAGVPHGHRVRSDEVYTEGDTPPWDRYFLWVTPIIAQRWLSAAPQSALVADPRPNTAGSSVYHAGWFFHRYLVDRFAGGSPSPLLFDLTAGGRGYDHVAETVGVPWHDLLIDFMAAILVDDVPDARAATSSRFVSYDFADILAAERREEYLDARDWPPFQADVPFGEFRWDVESWWSSPNLFRISAEGGGAPLLLDVTTPDGEEVEERDDVAMVVVRVR